MGDKDNQDKSTVPVLSAAAGVSGVVPVLTSAVAVRPDEAATPPLPVDSAAQAVAPARISEEEILALRSQLAVMTRDLTERLLEESLSELETTLFERVSSRLRDQLPDMLEQALRDHFDPQD